MYVLFFCWYKTEIDSSKIQQKALLVFVGYVNLNSSDWVHLIISWTHSQWNTQEGFPCDHYGDISYGKWGIPIWIHSQIQLISHKLKGFCYCTHSSQKTTVSGRGLRATLDDLAGRMRPTDRRLPTPVLYHKRLTIR